MFTPRLATAADLGDVRAIHKANKRWLGHLPDKPFEVAAEEGRLIVAVSADNRCAGYLLYRTRRMSADAAIVHLATAREFVKQGVGTVLLEALYVAAAGLRRITLSCRRDYPSHGFWLRAGFEAITEVAGRSADGKPLTRFERRLQNEATLFDGLYEASEPFAVDLDVLLDLASVRPQGRTTRDVFKQLDQFPHHPIRTVALSNELALNDDKAMRDAARAVIAHWQDTHVQPTPSRLGELCELFPDAERSDLEHLAHAEANDVSILLSRDTRFAAALDRAGRDRVRVRVMHPAAFIDRIASADSPDYQPHAVRGIHLEAASTFALPKLVDTFWSAAERKSSLRGELTDLLADTATEVKCIMQGEEPLCIYALTRAATAATVALFRVRTFDSTQVTTTVARQALAQIRRDAVRDGSSSSLRLRASPVSTPLERALVHEGFTITPDGWNAIAVDGALTVAHAAERLRRQDHVLPDVVSVLDLASLLPDAAATAERLLDPVILVDSALPAVMIPIQAGWSDRLLGVTRQQLALEVSDSRLSSLREHIYFRSPKGLRIPSPSRAFWYRTREGTSQVFATSVITQIATRPVPEIWGRFKGYGVLQKDEVASRADTTGQVMAIKFVRTRRLQRGVTLHELQSQATTLNCSRPSTPVGPIKLHPSLSRWLLGTEVGVE